MAWFAASLLYERTFANDETAPPLFEEQVFVLRADDEASARAAAIAIGTEHAHSYPNQVNEQVSWRFVTVIDVKELFDDPIGDGTQVFYRFLTKHEADVLRRAASAPLDDRSGPPTS